jgi:single-strand DNA-binding protein
MSLNKVMLIGRLTRDPEMRYTPSGQPVTSFSIATNRYGSGPDGDRREFTDYHNCVAWNIGKRNLAEIMGQNLKKGSLVYVEGRLQTRSWEGQDGQKRKTTEVIVNDFEFLESRGAGAAGAVGASGGAVPGLAEDGAAPEEAAVRDVDPDEIPF